MSAVHGPDPCEDCGVLHTPVGLHYADGFPAWPCCPDCDTELVEVTSGWLTCSACNPKDFHDPVEDDRPGLRLLRGGKR